MKNKKIIIPLVIVIVIAIIPLTIILTKKSEKNGPTPLPEELQTNEKIKPYLTLADRIIYTHELDNISFTYKNETKELKDWFQDNPNFLEEFLNYLEFETSYDDGGTSVYRDGGTKSFNYEDLTIIACHRLDGNNNIHIGRNLKYTNSVCELPTKEQELKNHEIMINNLKSELGAYITSEILIPHEVELSEILKAKLKNYELNSIVYSKMMVNEHNDMYAIIETFNDTTIESINKAFDKLYPGYKMAQVTDKIYVYVNNKASDYNLNYLSLTGTIKSIDKNSLNIITSDNKEYIVHYNFELNVKENNKIKVIYNGYVNESNPPQIEATYIEIISNS